MCTRLSPLVVDFVLHLGPLRGFFFANNNRTPADQNVTSPTYSTAQTWQLAPLSSAQVALGIIKSLVALNHGPLLPAPFTFS